MNGTVTPQSLSGWQRLFASDRAVFVLLAVVVACLYGQTLDVPFYFDDIPQIVNQPASYDLGLAARQLLRPRGIVNFTFALNVHFFGMSMPAFHLVNIVLHLMTGWLIFLIVKRVFPGRRMLCLFAALLFLCHPLQTQTVNYVVQRMAGMSGFFAFFALYLFIRARESYFASGWRSRQHLFFYAAFSLLTALAVLAKENTATLPFLLLLFDSVFIARDRRLSFWQRFGYVAPIIIVPALLGSAMLIKPIMAGKTLASLGNFENLLVDPSVITAESAPLHYFVTELSVLWLYLKLLVLPVHQLLDYGYPLVEDLFAFKNILAGFGLSLLIVTAILWRRRLPIFFFALFWFLGALLVESTFIPLDPVFEHRLYIPMFAFVVLVAALMESLLVHGRIALLVSLSILLVMSGLAFARNGVWTDPLHFFQHETKHTIGSYRPAIMLADEYYKRGDKVAAKREYDRVKARIESGAINKLQPKMLLNLAVAYGRFNDFAKAESLLRLALKRASQDGDIYYNLGIALYLQNRHREAYASFVEAKKWKPGDASILYYNILLAGQYGDKRQVPAMLAQMQRLNPGYAAELRAKFGY